MRDLLHDFEECFSALRSLHSLELYDTEVDYISKDQFHTRFPAFHETLTYLSLGNIAIPFSSFVTLVNYFPNVTTLELGSFVLEPDGGPIPSLSRPLRGKLHLHEVETDHLVFLNRFAKLDLEYEELVIESSDFIFTEAKFVESAIQMSTNTVKFLRLNVELDCE